MKPDTTPNVFCPDCGEPVPADAGFCRACGCDLAARSASSPAAAETAAPASVTTPCPQCGTDLPAEAQFCGSCGAPAGAEDPPTLVAATEPEGPRPTVLVRPTEPHASWPNVRVAAIVAAVVLVLGVGAAFALGGGGSDAPKAGSDAKATQKTGSVPTTATDALDAVASAIGAAADRAGAGDPTGTETDATTAPGSVDATNAAGSASDPAAASTDTTSTDATTTDATTTDATSTAASGAALRAQVQRLNALMRLSEQGRAAAIRGDTRTAAANRSDLLRRLRSLRADVDDPKLQAGVDAFIAAIRESLHQNRTCGSRCSPEKIARVGRLKSAALATLTPLLRTYAGTSYRSEDI